MTTGKKVTNTEEEIASTDEAIPDTEETTQNYEVGYGKPPKHTRFQKGVSGNPSGRTKKARDFYAELIKESDSPVTIKENGRLIRIPKSSGIARQLTNKATLGDMSALKTFVPLYLQAQERDALLKAQRAANAERFEDPEKLTTEELERLVLKGLKEKEKKKRK
jgi:hypothetical protein